MTLPMLLARWLIPGILRRYRLSIACAVVGMAIFGSAVPLISNVADSAASSEEGLGASTLRSIEITDSPTLGTPNPIPLNRDSLESIQKTEGVESAAGWSQILVGIKNVSEVKDAYVTSRYEPLQPKLIDGREPERPGELLISDTTASGLGVKIGDHVQALHNKYISQGLQEGVESEAVIVGTFNGDVAGIDGQNAAYAAASWVESLLAVEQGIPQDQISQRVMYLSVHAVVKTQTDIAPVVQRLNSQGFIAASLSSLMTAVQPVQAFLHVLRIVLAALLGMFLIVIAGTISASVLASKRGEIGLLKAFGWSKAEVMRTFLLQLTSLGIVVGATGFLAATAVAGVIAMIAPDHLFGLPMEAGFSPSTLVALLPLLIAPPVIFAVIAIFPTLRAASTPPDEVLRDLQR